MTAFSKIKDKYHTFVFNYKPQIQEAQRTSSSIYIKTKQNKTLYLSIFSSNCRKLKTRKSRVAVKKQKSVQGQGYELH